MDPVIIAAIIGACGAILAALINKSVRFSRTVLLAGVAVLGLSVAVLIYQKLTPEDPAPHIAITDIPQAAPGGHKDPKPIGGVVSGHVPKDALVVVYAYAGTSWFVQPDVKAPFTQILDYSWKTQTYPGMQYAALLVNASYIPPPVSPALPGGDGVLAAVQVNGR